MKNKYLIKKAQLVSNQLILLIILLVSFVAILSIFFYWNWNAGIDRETCHESVVLRSVYNGKFIETSDIVPLKCQTEKICITKGNNCNGIVGTTKSPVTKIQLSRNKALNNDEIKEAIAGALYDCHSMLGEGKLNFMPRSFWDENYCLICSRFAVDNETNNEIKDISYMELYQYMKSRETPGSRSYLEATYDVSKVDDMRTILENVRILFNEANSGAPIYRVEDMKIDLTKQNTIVVQIVPSSTWKSWIGGIAGGILVTGGIIAAPFTFGGSLTLTGVGIAVVAGGAVGGVVYYKSLPDGSQYGYPSIYPYSVDTLNNLKCTSFETAP
ncbi:MAG: hypothetical protein WC867_06860 [Candidatus Pacearchaeota archaeon]|jgi:hypothetical protein